MSSDSSSEASPTSVVMMDVTTNTKSSNDDERSTTTTTEDNRSPPPPPHQSKPRDETLSSENWQHKYFELQSCLEESEFKRQKLEMELLRDERSEVIHLRLTTENAELRTDCHRLRTELREEKRRSATNPHQDLLTQRDSFRREACKVNLINSTLCDQITNLQEQLSNSRDNNNNNNSNSASSICSEPITPSNQQVLQSWRQLEVAQTNLQETELRLKEASAKLLAVESKNRKLLRDSVLAQAALRCKEERERQLGLVQTALAEKERELTDCRTQLDEASPARVEWLQAEMSQASIRERLERERLEESHAETVTELREESSQLQARLVHARRDALAEHETLTADLRLQLSEQATQVRASTKEAREARAQLETWRRSRQHEREDELRELRSRLSDDQTIITELRLEVVRSERYQQESTSRMEEVAELRVELEQTQQETSSLQEEITELRSQLVTLEHAKEELSFRNEELQLELDSHTHEDDHSEEIESLRAALEKREELIEKTQASLLVLKRNSINDEPTMTAILQRELNDARRDAVKATEEGEVRRAQFQKEKDTLIQTHAQTTADYANKLADRDTTIAALRIPLVVLQVYIRGRTFPGSARTPLPLRWAIPF